MDLALKFERLFIRAKLAAAATHPKLTRKLSVASESGHCFACGFDGAWNWAQVINDDLAITWEIPDFTRYAFDCRESMFCPTCGCSFRLRQIAEVLVHFYAQNGETSLKELIQSKDFKKLEIAEINSCGVLHQFLKLHPHLTYSEYGSKDPNVEHQDLAKLTYKGNSFDIVLDSDTLEHVPDFMRAFREIHRVLKPGGRHIFTIPVVWYRQTRTRATLDGQKQHHLEKPSFHGAGEPDYLVFTEYGYDVIQKLKAAGFAVKLFGINPVNLGDVSCVIVATKLE